MNDDLDSRVVIVRGLPGSGKSTLAREIARICGYVHVENDMYFEAESGYEYDRSRLGEAQQWCLRVARDAVLAGKKVVVSNVFTKVEHMDDFMQLHDDVAVIECLGSYGSVHDVPADVLGRMRASWEPYASAIRI
ncbi:ATP-binding protein [Diaphorobacter sp. J5-51]|uniref:ATP-binding protein n=1 Tax=Diaphorobacter sp. J5-51 TaxID=680496 RepID=UPI0018FF0A64|nr:ATP-binding protein [Diaphorobacter sp. J5-51]